jgi:hypothetical protein
MVLIVEILSAAFLTSPESSSQQVISYDVQHASFQLPAFLKEQEEKRKEYFSISITIQNFFSHDCYRSVSQNFKNQKIPFPYRPLLFALFCSLLI